MTQYIVKSPLRHNGKRYEIGEQVELSDSETKHLEAQGVIVAAEPKSEPKSKGKK